MSEESAADALEDELTALYRPGKGYSGWGVYVGSHGGDGRTLAKAMRACLMCCGLGGWWRTEYGGGEPLVDLFDRVSREHLGKPLYRNGNPWPSAIEAEREKL